MVLGGLFNTTNSLNNVPQSSTSKNPAMPNRSAHNNKPRNPYLSDNKKESKLKGLLSDYLLEKGIILPKNIDSQNKTGVSNLSKNCNLPCEILLAQENENIFINNLDEHDHETNNNVNEFDDDVLNHQSVLNDCDTTTHKFSIIIKLNDRLPIKQINMRIMGDVLMYWYANESKEFYKVSNKDWQLDLDQCNTFIDFNSMLIKENHAFDFNNESCGAHNSFIYKNFDDSRILHGDYLPLATSRKNLFVNEIVKNSTSGKKKGETQYAKFYDPGYYIFFMPLSFSNNVYESVSVPSARLKYLLQVSVMISKTLYKRHLQSQPMKANDDVLSLTSNSDSESIQSVLATSSSSNRSSSFMSRISYANPHFPTKSINHTGNDTFDTHGIIYGESLLNVVKTAPPRELSTANKPIYINRVWNNSLAYEISLPEKFVPLDTELPIKMKFTPLDKTLKIKRIRVGIVEKIFVKNKDLTAKFNQMEPLMADKTNPYYADFIKNNKKYRCLSVLEVKPNRQTGHSSMKEVVITNCANDNICQFRSNQIDSIVLNSKIKFPKFVPFATNNLTKQQLVQLPPPYGVDKYEIIKEELGSRPQGSEGTQNIEGYIEESNTFKEVHADFINSSSGVPVQFLNIYKRSSRGLYPSSTSFPRIQVKHKLEMVIRISQKVKNPKDSKEEYKHFEVVIDTPIVLLSDVCKADSMLLPSYTSAMVDELAKSNLDDKVRPPPGFEYVLSVPNSPPTSHGITSAQSVKSMNDINERYSKKSKEAHSYSELNFSNISQKHRLFEMGIGSLSFNGKPGEYMKAFDSVFNEDDSDSSDDESILGKDDLHNSFLPSYEDTVGFME
ncbi:uncharacterized protein HGUI_01608 [Hanseniaspora guilliermondii]|uniref:Arrestin C-terminal-like domain-containing protein n=1 Tax=Hanseniaspora guilliermondii TaxID=56406 RepID=A0A1L0AZ71_9ASCO|nr:uncharacterized protein HGUI_01608 [Hanseniaspora guilliermondii]